jgi:hypothetical protein
MAVLGVHIIQFGVPGSVRVRAGEPAELAFDRSRHNRCDPPRRNSSCARNLGEASRRTTEQPGTTERSAGRTSCRVCDRSLALVRHPRLVLKRRMTQPGGNSLVEMGGLGVHLRLTGRPAATLPSSAIHPSGRSTSCVRRQPMDGAAAQYHALDVAEGGEPWRASAAMPAPGSMAVTEYPSAASIGPILSPHSTCRQLSQDVPVRARSTGLASPGIRCAAVAIGGAASTTSRTPRSAWPQPDRRPSG